MVGNKAKQTSEAQRNPKDLSLQVQSEWKWQIHFPCKYIWKAVQFLKLLWTPAKHNWISKFKDEKEITLIKTQSSPPQPVLTQWTWLCVTENVLQKHLINRMFPFIFYPKMFNFSTGERKGSLVEICLMNNSATRNSQAFKHFCGEDSTHLSFHRWKINQKCTWDAHTLFCSLHPTLIN